MILHRDVWPLVLPPSTQRLLDMKKGDSWAGVSKELSDVVSSSPLGQKLFGFAAAKLIEEDVEKIINEELKTLTKMAKVTELEYAALKRNATEKVMALPNIALLPDRRVVHIMYREVAIELRVSCLAEQIDLSMTSCLRTLAVHADVLSPLPCELYLPKPTVKMEVEAKLLEAAKVARKFATDMMNAEDCQHASAIQAGVSPIRGPTRSPHNH